MVGESRYKPVLASEWKPFFKPEVTGHYVNDHTIIKANDGQWHIIGITSLSAAINPEHERYFVHGWGGTLEEGLHYEEKAFDHGSRAWAPGVIMEGGRYYLYYGPSPTKMAVSHDLHHWINHEIQLIGSPIDACHRDHMVVKINSYTWVMYVTGIREGYGCISCYVSNDLVSWRFVQYALTTSGHSALNPAWGATESPYVVYYEGHYYLFITYTDCSDETYNETLVFCSTNPYDFGDFNPDVDNNNLVARLFGHAAEVIQDPDSGDWYMTTCGWADKKIPHEGAVSIARIEWQPY